MNQTPTQPPSSTPPVNPPPIAIPPFDNVERVNIFSNFRASRNLLYDEVDRHITGYVYAFMTTPELNINVERGRLDAASSFLDLTSDTISESVIKPLRGRGSTHKFFFLLSNMFKSISIDDIVLDTKQAFESFVGNSITYGMDVNKSKVGQSFQIVYGETIDLDVLRTHEIWVNYIRGCKLGVIKRSEENLSARVLDYGASLYVFITKPDGETITMYSKYTGLFPTAIPYSSVLNGNDHTSPDITIPYTCSYREVGNSTILSEFAQIVGDRSNTIFGVDKPELLKDKNPYNETAVQGLTANRATDNGAGVPVEKKEDYLNTAYKNSSGVRLVRVLTNDHSNSIFKLKFL